MECLDQLGRMKVLVVEIVILVMGVCVELVAGWVLFLVDVGLDYGKRLVHLIVTVLGECGLIVDEFDFIVCGIGFGFFIGVRIGVVMVFGMVCVCCVGLIGVLGFDVVGYCFSHFFGVVFVLIDVCKCWFYGVMYCGGWWLIGYLDESVETIVCRVFGF